MQSTFVMKTTVLGIGLGLILLLASCAETDREGGATHDGFEEGPPLVQIGGKTDEATADIPSYAPLPEGADLELPLDVLFAPDDPTTTLEVELIDRVIQARRDDSKIYLEGGNPYRIRYAVYNLRNPVVTERLADAEDLGVDVPIRLDAKQLDPARTWNTADEYLQGRGFELVGDRRDLDDQTRDTADLIGVASSGLMHLKARVYETPTWRAALSGSMNPGDNAVFNEETLHLIRETRLIDRYSTAFEAVRDADKIGNEWDEDAATNVMFTPSYDGPRAVTKVLQWVADEHEQILMMVYSLRNISAPGVSGSLVDILGAKARAGIPVIVITDRKQSDGVDASGNRVTWDDKTEDSLRRAGVHVYEATNCATQYTAMHHKVAVLGRTTIRVISDAANWTNAGLGSSSKRARNFESVLFVDSAQLDQGRIGRRYLAQFLRVLKRYAPQSVEIDGEPAYDVIASRLFEAADWPTQQVTFSALHAYTDWGEHVAVVGDIEALGSWGDVGAGVSLETDAETYPTWNTPSAIELPCGTQFEWKLVVQDDQLKMLEWETGGNHVDIAAPGVLDPGGDRRLTATWR